MYYKVTLLKDLPDVEAGFSFSISEDALKDHGSFIFRQKTKSGTTTIIINAMFF